MLENLIALVYDINPGMTKAQAKATVQAVLRSISRELATENRVQLSGIGTLRVEEVGERTHRNPKTGEPVVKAAHKTVKFRASKSLKAKVNQ